MSILPVQLSRVTDLLSSSVADQSINATQQQLIQIQNELSTGLQVTQPSDNPGAASTILALNRSLSLNQEYSSNASTAQTQLGVVSSTLTGLENLLVQAQGIASNDVNTGVNQSQLTADAQVVNSLISEAQGYANTQSDGVYLFGGQNSTQQPYTNAGGGVQYVGSNSVLETQADNGLLLPTEVSGQSVFGGTSDEVVGTADLTPDVTDQTQLSSLGGATNQGVSLGSFQLSNGTSSATIDLSSAQTLGDVVTAINAAGVGGITASLGTNGIDLSGTSGDNITVTDTGGSNTAEELGIATSASGAGAGNSVTGTALNPQVTEFTPLSDLRGGAGIDPTGFILTSNGVSKTISIPSGGDVQSLLNEINGSGLGVVASINSAGNGINVQSNVQGVTMTIGEDGGTTATDLGIRSFSPSTELSSLNNGQGVGTAVAGSNGDFTITAADGSSFNVSIAGAQTVQDVIGDINSAATTAGVNVSASFATTGNGIVLSDGTTGSGTLSVAAINASPAAADLGLTNPASGNTITGSDVNGVQTSGIFSDLQALATALTNGDTAGITAAAQKLQTDATNVSQANGVAGATSDEYQNISSQLQDQNTATQTFLSNVQDANMTTAISQFQTLQTALEAALETTATSQSLTLLNFLT
jgi:flagellar hook-associated protein 3 FlgL